MKLLKCPDCESDKVILRSVQSFMANTGEFFCESVKISDSNSSASCLDCYWDGRHDQLLGYGEE